MQSGFYYLQPKCGHSRKLVLGIGQNGAIQLVTLDMSSRCCFWKLTNGLDAHLYQSDRDTFFLQAVAHHYEGLRMAFKNSNGPVGFFPNVDTRTVPYEALLQAMWHIVAQYDGRYAVQLASDTSLNLNAAGNDYWPGTPVFTYTWCGGNPNELWEFYPVSQAVIDQAH